MLGSAPSVRSYASPRFALLGGFLLLLGEQTPRRVNVDRHFTVGREDRDRERMRSQTERLYKRQVQRDDDGKTIPFTVKAGDKVLISKYGGTEIKVDDVTYLIMREDDILGILG